jgi:hypothetical protein
MHRALRLLVVFSGLAATALLSSSIAAADWPSRPVTIVVPFGAGGNTDMITAATTTLHRVACPRPSRQVPLKRRAFLVDNAPRAGPTALSWH